VYAFLGHPSAFKQYSLDPRPYLDYATNFTHRRPTIVLPDYSPGVSVADLFTQLASAIVQHGQGLELLHYVGLVGATTHQNSHIASWVPRWDGNGRLRFPHHVEVTYRTSPNFPMSPIELLPKRVAGLHALQIRAVLLDSMYASSLILAHEFEPPVAFSRGNSALLGVYGCIDKLGDRLHDRHLDVRAQLINTLTAGLRSHTFHEWERGALQFEIWSDVLSISDGRRFFVTQEGRFGLGPILATGSHDTWTEVDNPLMDQSLANRRLRKKGDSNKLVADQIWLPMGATMPFVLRPVADKRFKILGPCYLQGMMMGEAVKGLKEDYFETITLV
jgi:hypothetical protein